MKGFPNQVSNLQTLASALRILSDLEAEGKNTKRDDVFGKALVRRGILGTGHTGMTVEEYLTQQQALPASYRGFQASARGLRELFRALKLIDDSGPNVELTAYGDQVASLAEPYLDDEAVRVWRRVLTAMSHYGGDEEASHPYGVLLRLVARNPGISRAKCALALEARNDSEEELDRITELSKLEESEILSRLGESKPNWDNAKKILPSFAEQLGDVEKVGSQLFVVASDLPEERVEEPVEPETGDTRRPRSPSRVTPETIAKAGTTETWDEADEPPAAYVDVEALELRRAKLRDRLRRHNLIVQKLAARLEEAGAILYEYPFDCLARFEVEVLLIEAKSLDGTESDEVTRVRHALAQLLYYESFDAEPIAQQRTIVKVACFEQRISDEHAAWLERNGICVVWDDDSDLFEGNSSARETLANYIAFRDS